MKRAVILMIFLVLPTSFVIAITPLGLGVFESGWKFSYQNPAEVYYIDKTSVSFTIKPYFGDRKEIVSWVSIMQPANDGNFAGVLAFNRHYYEGSGDTYSLEYHIAGGRLGLSWGAKISTEYMALSSATDYSLKVSFGVDGFYNILRYGFVIEDLYLYSSNPSVYMMGRYVAAVGVFTKNYALHFGGYTLNFDIYGGYLGIALDFTKMAVGGRVEYLYDPSLDKGYFGYQLGAVVNIDYISIGGAYGSSVQPASYSIPFTDVGKKNSLMFSLNIKY
ncbi:MAG: hypothetical protein J7L34_05345 [Thermotogaceae bacterium]|nr:hypothetical protein [Thermotogaceae bacterium]